MVNSGVVHTSIDWGIHNALCVGGCEEKSSVRTAGMNTSSEGAYTHCAKHERSVDGVVDTIARGRGQSAH